MDDENNILTSDQVPMSMVQIPTTLSSSKSKKINKHVHDFVLYLRFHKKLTGDRPKAKKIIQRLNEKITNVRLPRQKSANYCLVDFLTKDDMDQARPQLSAIKIHGKPIKVSIAKTQNPIQMAKKIQLTAIKQETKDKVKNLIENINRSLARNPNVSQTNCVVMKNIPKTIQESDVKKKFPHAIEFRFIPPKHGLKKMIAIITLPTPQEAYQATKKCVIINGEVFFLALQKNNNDINIKIKGDKSKKDALRKGPFSRYYARDVNDLNKPQIETEIKIYE